MNSVCTTSPPGSGSGTFPCPASSVGSITARPEGGTEAWFTYTDYTSPTAVYRYDARTHDVVLWQKSPGTVEAPPVRTEQVTYTSRDGTPVRMLVVSPPDREGPRPAILYGYGGFGISLTPAYSASILAWVAAGGVYAVASLRGGLEEGEEWHRAGMLGNKQNVFDDCHAAAEYLVDAGFTTREQLSVMGGSNGGLLVGAAITQRPELYAAAVCSAPLLDMVRYEQFGLGQLWSVEYGSASDPEALQWLLAYSPYHNVREGVRYPATLFTVFENDTRVDPLHARKMCAALQHATSAAPEEAPILLRRETDVGHSTRSVSRSVRLAADQLAFLAITPGCGSPTVLEGRERYPGCPLRCSNLPQSAGNHDRRKGRTSERDSRAGRHQRGNPDRAAARLPGARPLRDLDPLNHVNNVRMLTYLEDARISLLRWDDADSSSRFGDVVVARHEVDYLRPLQMRRDPFRVETWVTEIRNASFTVRYEILDDDAVYLKALSVLVAYDLAQQRPRRLSPEERAHLARYYLP